MAALRTGTSFPQALPPDDRGRWAGPLGGGSCVSIATGDGTTARWGTVWLLTPMQGRVWVGVLRGACVLWLGSVAVPNLVSESIGLVFDWQLPQCDGLVVQLETAQASPVVAVEVSPLPRGVTANPSSSFDWDTGNKPQ